MKIGIQSIPKGFSRKWIEYCEESNIDYKLIDVYKNDVIKQLKDCEAFMWHYDHLSKKDHQVAKRLLTAVEHAGKVCFPSIYENWHYDDKVAQKYLLEAIGAPLIPSYVFFEEKQALEWANTTSWPKVFKLTGGAGSSNVKLINSKKEAQKVIRKSFRSGYIIFDQRKYFLEESLSKYRKNKSLLSLFKNFYHLLKPINKELVDHIEKDYVYFQEFMPSNNYDSRIIVINQNKVFGYKRFNREKDFRASGSGSFEQLKPENVDERILKIALEISQKLKMNSIAYDFIYDKNNQPIIIEITFAYGTKGANNSPGYWDENLMWHEGMLDKFQYWMIEKVIEQVNAKDDKLKYTAG